MIYPVDFVEHLQIVNQADRLTKNDIKYNLTVTLSVPLLVCLLPFHVQAAEYFLIIFCIEINEI